MDTSRNSTYSPHQVVYFEGGLGSQLMSLFELTAKRRIFQGNVYTDFTYFDFPFQSTKNSIWRQWRLEEYGLPIDVLRSADFLEDEQVNRVFQRPSMAQHAKFLLKNDVYNNCSLDSVKLPFGVYEDSPTDNYLDSCQGSYGAIHLRRGDYLKVASHLITFNHLYRCLQDIVEIFPENSFFFSDSKLKLVHRAKLQKLFKSVGKSIFLPSPRNNSNDIAVHNMMRKASVLIASNSTYSYSAAILNNLESAKIFVPKIFNKGEAASMNSVYSSVKRFNLY